MKFSDKLIVFVAQGFGIGRIPFAPGTWGSLLGIAAFVYFYALLGQFPVLMLIAFLLVALAAVWICGRAAAVLGEKDPGSVVLDEIAALPLCFVYFFLNWRCPPRPDHFFTGLGLITLLIPFLLFRLFDIWKPWPVRQSQALPGGWGVVMDDVLAAVYVNLVVIALFAAAHLFG